VSSRRLGILGGSFDPPHAGHLALAAAAREGLGLDRVLVIPAARAPLRDGAPSASAADRLLLLRLAFEDLPWAEIDDREIRRGGVSYSVDTARELAAGHPGAELHWILGADQLSRLHLWREAPELCRLVRFAVFPREGARGEVDPSLAGLARVGRLGVPEVRVSSTEIRRALAAGLPLGKALPPAVAAAIEARRLYRPSP
jgi:nicotinate-nucleotide adenylyltransferase